MAPVFTAREIGPSTQRAGMVVVDGHSGLPVSLRCTWAMSGWRRRRSRGS